MNNSEKHLKFIQNINQLFKNIILNLTKNKIKNPNLFFSWHQLLKH